MASAGKVVEISSDEEEDVPMAGKPLDDWLGKFFDDDVDEANGDDLSDLVVMAELSAPPVPPQKMAKSDACGEDEDDDDCVVLDGDPDKGITVGEDKGCVGDSSSDELQIVGEKGPVACRDFPHSRHLCSNLPFNTTSHATHCGMCHCFVCDAPAPCNSWGKGISLNDHCHATDKETRWKLLRQAFKCKSLPASRPEQRQNAMYPTTPSSRQQDIQCQVSVVQSQPPLLSNIGGSSFANGSHVLNVMNQNRQSHTSVRVSLNVERTISTQRASPATRAGSVMSNVRTSQNTHSRGTFKRVGTVSPGHTVRNANQFGSTASSSTLPLINKALPHVSQPVQAKQGTNAFSGTVRKNAPQRSLSAPIASDRQQGQRAPSYQVASNGVHGIGAQLPRCTSLMTQRTQFRPDQVMDVSTQSWQDILASVASDLGVLDGSEYNSSAAESQQPLRASSQPRDSGANQAEEGLHAESVASTANLMTSNGHDLPSHIAGGDVQPNIPVQTTQTLQHLNYKSSISPHEAHLDVFVSSPADELLVEAALQRESSGLDSTDLVFDFELDDWA